MKFICTWIIFEAGLHFYFVDHCFWCQRQNNFSKDVDWVRLQVSELFGVSFKPSLFQEFLYCLYVHPNTLFRIIADLILEVMSSDILILTEDNDIN